MDADDTDVVEPEIRKAKPRRRIYIEGDDLFIEVGRVAETLSDRGSDELADETLGWLRGALAAAGARKGAG